MIYKVTFEPSLNFYHPCLIYDLIFLKTNYLYNIDDSKFDI